ncbi:MAG: trigger factor [Prevotella sp.]|nr:trigger factor [Prevotella sp.]MDD7189146.1 trigger factor [Prevotella sp.]MDY5313047.1 trigger factor [Prevotella sp.]
MKVSFDCPDKINGLLTVTIEEDDFKNDVEKELKNYRKRANVPGFRPGMVPMGLIRRQYGNAVKMDVVNNKLSEEVNKYIQDNKINMLGMPLGSEKQTPVDLEKDAPYTFMFDIAVAPEFDIELSDKDAIDYYDITVDDKLVDQQVDGFASRFGAYQKAEEYKEGDVLKGDLRELDAEGNTKEGGVEIEGATVMPQYLKDDDQKKLFEGAKAGDIITFNPYKAYAGGAEVATLLKVEREKKDDYQGDFSYQITEVQHFEKHAVDQELFDQVFGKDEVKDEKSFREKIAEGVKQQLATDEDFRFLQDLRKYAEEKVGQLTYPEALLKRVLKENNKDKDDEFINKNYEASLKDLTWSLIKNKLAEKAEVKVNDDDVKNVAREIARAQFAQYGMQNVGEEYVNNYAEELLKQRDTVNQFAERAVDEKLVAAIKPVVKLNHKEISLEDFNKMVTAEQA